MLLTPIVNPQEGGLGAILMSLLPIILLIAVFYFMIIRPQRKKDKENREMLASLTVGDNITTIGGICGKITSIREDIVIVEVGADKVKLVFERWAIRNVDKITAD
ncbi:MAG TPA: preprotein translocase subunit YajC [Clostridia bacterium]|nr:preprotein translocase subunit YajC [Clostridia bacterium]